MRVRRTAAMAACSLIGLAAVLSHPRAWAARVALPEEAAARLAAEVAAEGQVTGAPWAAAGLQSDLRVSRRDIDLLLDVQLSALELGRTPADAAASAPQQAAVDVRSLSPGVPANPIFPGYGLSYEPPAVAVRPSLPEAMLAPDQAAGRSGLRAWSGGAAWLAGDGGRDDPMRERLRGVSEWVGDHRVALLVGLGLLVLLAASTVALLRRLAPTAPAAAGSGRSRRRRKGTAHRATPQR